MKIKLLTLLSIPTLLLAQANKKELDRKAINALGGCYNITFDYAETFASDTTYKYHSRYHESALELVLPVEQSENKIVLQHLLVAGEKMIIKHWREDWLFENTELLKYDKDLTWTKNQLPTFAVSGQWTQKVYQVDDSPRYESSATWVHVDGKHTWSSETDSPLPRREHTKRSDYNVLQRGNRLIIDEKKNEVMFEQDNLKVDRGAFSDKPICWEKGYERFTKVDDEKCKVAADWWKNNGKYWQDVRVIWTKVLSENNKIAIQPNNKYSLK